MARMNCNVQGFLNLNDFISYLEEVVQKDDIIVVNNTSTRDQILRTIRTVNGKDIVSPSMFYTVSMGDLKGLGNTLKGRRPSNIHIAPMVLVEYYEAQMDMAKTIFHNMGRYVCKPDTTNKEQVVPVVTSLFP